MYARNFCGAASMPNRSSAKNTTEGASRGHLLSARSAKWPQETGFISVLRRSTAHVYLLEYPPGLLSRLRSSSNESRRFIQLGPSIAGSLDLLSAAFKWQDLFQSCRMARHRCK